MKSIPTHVAFVGARKVAEGPLAEVIPALKRRFDKDPSEIVLVFERESGRQVDFDLRGTVEEALARALPADDEARGRGRPKLGVVSREVTLLPAQWDWLEQESHGISGALRRLVQEAMRKESGAGRARRRRAALGRFLTSMAGDRPNYEEASRALYAGETKRFESLVARWPKDVREYAVALAREAAREERASR
jgi:hypothetical protein